MVTEGVAHGVYKVVAQSSFGVIQRHKVSLGTQCFGTVSQLCIFYIVVEGHGTPITVNCTACSVMETQNL